MLTHVTKSTKAAFYYALLREREKEGHRWKIIAKGKGRGARESKNMKDKLWKIKKRRELRNKEQGDS